MTHIFPLAEQHMHDLNTHTCACHPRIDFDEGIVIHNVFAEQNHDEIEVPMAIQIERLIAEAGMIP